MVILIWTEIAIEDLHSIHKYISKDSKVYAGRYIRKIINRVNQLKKFPKSGRVVPEFNSEFLRELIEGNYRIVYRVNSLSISVIRIHHSARQLSL